MARGTVLLAAAAWLAAGLAIRPAAAEDKPAAEPLKVFVSIQPEAYFVERIGGAHVSVDVLVGPGQSPHVFEPSPKQMVALEKARLFFSIGWPFEERLMDKIRAVSPDLKIVDLRQGITMRMMTADEQAADEAADLSAEAKAKAEAKAADMPPHPAPLPPRGEGDKAASPSLAPGEHTGGQPANEPQGEPDPHLWLSPANARILAATIAKTLIALDAAHAEEFKKNLAALDADLARLDETIAKSLAPLKGKEFFVYHPAFGYFADAYGLRQVPVEIEGKEPTARQLTALVARAKKDGVRVIFVEPQFSPRSAEVVAGAIGGAVVPMDDLARDYIANLSDMAEKIRKALAAP